jgi:hypothetical protein
MPARLVATAPRPAYRWDRAVGRYRSSNGAFVAPSTVRAYLDTALSAATKRIDALATQLRTGRIDLISWEVAMRREVKNVALYSASAAKGGWAQMSDADYGRAGQYIQAQYRYLRGFAQRIQTGKQPLDGRLNNVAALYGDAGRPLYHRMEVAEQRVRGMAERRNVPSDTDGCDGCLEATAAGWVAIDDSDIPEIGERDCRTRCRCEWEFRKAGEEG